MGSKQLRKIDLGKFGSFLSDNLINKPFNCPLEISKNDLRILENYDYLQDFNIDPTQETEANNQELIDDSTRQKLSQSEIEQLKVQSLDDQMNHQTLIKTIIDNNENFNEKTEFSKAKYIKRKVKKFSKIFIPIKPTARTLLDFYAAKNHEKVRELRIDTLSQMLTLANVRAGSKLLVVDDTCGLIATAILERTRGLNL